MFNTYSTPQRAPVNPEKEAKRLKLEAARDYHQQLLDDLGVDRIDFHIKMAFYARGKEGQYVGIFDSEFKREKGLFFELVNKDNDPIDEERTVYRIPPSSSFAEEYEQTEKGSYLVPLEEIRSINKQAVAISKADAVTANDNINIYHQGQQKQVTTAYKAPNLMEDAPYSEMTIRDYITIHTGKPVSTKTWLNDLIKSQLTK